MKNYTLVQYGAFNFTGHPCVYTATEDGTYSHGIDIQRLPNARSNGSTVLDSQVTEKEIAIDISVVSDNNQTASDVWDAMNIALEDKNRYLRFIQTWEDVAPITSATGWTATGDAESIAYTQTERRFDGGISFDADVSNTADNFAGIYKSDLTGVDLSAYDELGNFEVMIKIPTIADVSGVKVRIGSDSSNYYEFTYTSQLLNNFQDGWNIMSVAWSDMTETGTANIALMGKYTFVEVQYSSLQTDITGIVLGGVYWQQESDTRNYLCVPAGVSFETINGLKTMRNATVMFLNQSGVAESTLLETVYSASGLSGVNNDVAVVFGGSYEPKPLITLSYEAATSLFQVGATNLANGDSVIVSGDTIASGDTLVIDTDSGLVTLASDSIDYESVLPRFNIGRNVLRISNLGTTTSLSQLTQNATLTLGTGGVIVGSIRGAAQSFTAPIDGVLTSWTFYLWTFASNAFGTYGLYSDNAGKPGTLLATSGTFGPVGGSFAEYTANFNYAVTNGTLYWVVLDSLPTVGFSTYLGYNTAGGYAGGSFLKKEVTVVSPLTFDYTAVTGDAYFRATIVTTPTVNFDLSIQAKKYYK
jgi:hypothetical protein